MKDWVDEIAGPTLIVSLLSAVATGLVLVVWLTSTQNPAKAAEKNSLREALVLNLMVAGAPPLLPRALAPPPPPSGTTLV